MLKKTIAPLLIGTVLLFTLVPSKAFAQTPAQPKAAASEHTLSNAQVKPQPELKAVFAREMANVKARTLTAADYKWIEKKRQEQESKQASKGGMTKGEKIGLVVFIVGTTVLVALLLIHGIDDSAPTCFDDPSNPLCI
jgi:hypothetical protein